LQGDTMQTTVFVFGLACIVAAIVGGGIEALGQKLPVISSRLRQALLGVFGLALVIVFAPVSTPFAQSNEGPSTGPIVDQKRGQPTVLPDSTRAESQNVSVQHSDAVRIPAASAAAVPSLPKPIDLNAYCRDTYGGSATLGSIDDAYSWKCKVGDRLYVIDGAAACHQEYGSKSAVQLGSRSDAYSWSCS